MSNEKQNPANVPGIPENFRPMSAAVLRLEVPERPGYHRHWFRGTPERIMRAQQAGYQFVNKSDVRVNSFDLAGAAEGDGNTDMGSRVSVISGEDTDASGQATRLYLMECPLELYKEGQRILGLQNDMIAKALTTGDFRDDEETDGDHANRYSKKKVPELFRKKT